MINHPSVILKIKTHFLILIQHKFGQRAKILSSVLTYYIIFFGLFFQTKKNLPISLIYIRVTSVAHVPTSPNFYCIK